MQAGLTVGDFSRITHLSVKTLRHYHEVGLLAPAGFDEADQKLAKSTSATGLRELRAAGVQPFEIRRRVGLGR